MIYLIKGCGNHSNRLFQSIHFEAFCLENKIPFSSICFEDMKFLYNLKRNPFNNLFRFIIYALYFTKLLKVINFSTEETSQLYEDLLKKRKNVFVYGWFFRRENLTIKYRNIFQKKYSLSPSLYKDNKFVIDSLSKKSSNEIILGVHLRRGDYKEWQNGKYYFENKVFDDYINHFTKINNENKVKIILFSNENLEYEESETLYISHEQWFIDQYIMSKCDYLIGPPSTFTGWASYIGEVPLLCMEKKEAHFLMNDFHIING